MQPHNNDNNIKLVCQNNSYNNDWFARYQSNKSIENYGKLKDED